MIGFALLALTCKTTEDPAEFESSNLPGMIYDGDNSPCEQVRIRAFKIQGGDEEALFSVETDINGRFTLPGLDRGDYRIVAEKEGYESLESFFSYASRMEVLYLKMYSQDQLLVLAADSLDQGRYDKALSFLVRSAEVDGGNPRHLYTYAVYSYHSGEFEKALESLEKIPAAGFDSPWVYLLMGDIYQYKLDNPLKALEALRQFSFRVDDGEVKSRIKELENL